MKNETINIEATITEKYEYEIRSNSINTLWAGTFTQKFDSLEKAIDSTLNLDTDFMIQRVLKLGNDEIAISSQKMVDEVKEKYPSNLLPFPVLGSFLQPSIVRKKLLGISQDSFEKLGIAQKTVEIELSSEIVVITEEELNSAYLSNPRFQSLFEEAKKIRDEKLAIQNRTIREEQEQRDYNNYQLWLQLEQKRLAGDFEKFSLVTE
jgi:hypothetical protein